MWSMNLILGGISSITDLRGRTILSLNQINQLLAIQFSTTKFLRKEMVILFDLCARWKLLLQSKHLYADWLKILRMYPPTSKRWTKAMLFCFFLCFPWCARQIVSNAALLHCLTIQGPGTSRVPGFENRMKLFVIFPLALLIFFSALGSGSFRAAICDRKLGRQPFGTNRVFKVRRFGNVRKEGGRERGWEGEQGG